MHLPVHEYTTPPGILVWRVLPTFGRDILVGLTRRIETIVEKAVGFGEPGDQVFVIHVIHRDVKVLVPFDEPCVVVEMPVNDRKDMRDVAVGQGLWPTQ
jgi:hypothetical protein